MPRRAKVSDPEKCLASISSHSPFTFHIYIRTHSRRHILHLHTPTVILFYFFSFVFFKQLPKSSQATPVGSWKVQSIRSHCSVAKLIRPNPETWRNEIRWCVGRCDNNKDVFHSHHSRPTATATSPWLTIPQSAELILYALWWWLKTTRVALPKADSGNSFAKWRHWFPTFSYPSPLPTTLLQSSSPPPATAPRCP